MLLRVNKNSISFPNGIQWRHLSSLANSGGLERVFVPSKVFLTMDLPSPDPEDKSDSSRSLSYHHPTVIGWTCEWRHLQLDVASHEEAAFLHVFVFSRQSAFFVSRLIGRKFKVLGYRLFWSWEELCLIFPRYFKIFGIFLRYLGFLKSRVERSVEIIYIYIFFFVEGSKNSLCF